MADEAVKDVSLNKVIEDAAVTVAKEVDTKDVEVKSEVKEIGRAHV